MKLENLKKDYYAGKILKSEYIKKMHSIHQILFEYSQSIKETDIKKIEIKDDNVLMTTRENEIKMLCDSYIWFLCKKNTKQKIRYRFNVYCS